MALVFSASINPRIRIHGTPLIPNLAIVQASEAAAAASALAAQTAETNAETAETAAELAETNAEAAQTAAEAAQVAAEAAQAAAEAAASGLTTALAVDYLTGTATGDLANERVVTNNPQFTWDVATANIARLLLAGGSLGFQDGMVNGALVASVAASALTVAIKTLAGTDPTAADPVLIVFRNATDATGDYAVITVTAATSFVVSSGSTLGTINSTPFRLWLVGFNDAGTFRLGVIKCTTATSITPLSPDTLSSSTAEGGAGAADSSGVFYTGTAVTTKAYRVLGYMTWESGLATAGTWSAGPTKIQIFGPSIPLPGHLTGRRVNLNLGSGSGTTSASFVDVTGATLSITPSSAINSVRSSWTFNCNITAGGAATNSQLDWQLLRSATQVAAGSVGTASGAGANLQVNSGQAIVLLDNPATASAVTYKLQQRSTTAGTSTATTNSINGILEEVMG